jgi:hypothetical protein
LYRHTVKVDALNLNKIQLHNFFFFVLKVIKPVVGMYVRLVSTIAHDSPWLKSPQKETRMANIEQIFEFRIQDISP